jgi:hypothetical protein
VGNTAFPLLEVNPQLTVYACDFSPRAIEIVQAHPAYASGVRIKYFFAASFDFAAITVFTVCVTRAH